MDGPCSSCVRLCLVTCSRLFALHGPCVGPIQGSARRPKTLPRSWSQPYTSYQRMNHLFGEDCSFGDLLGGAPSLSFAGGANGLGSGFFLVCRGCKRVSKWFGVRLKVMWLGPLWSLALVGSQTTVVCPNVGECALQCRAFLPAGRGWRRCC